MFRHRVLREPLLHFLGIGLVLFGLYALVSPGNSGSGAIIVSAAVVADLEAQHRKLFGQAPSPAELQGLIASYVDEEIMFREGLAMGLDRDDAVIKRRVMQKFDLVSDDDDNAATPTDATLVDWMQRHPETFRLPPVVGFTQVLLPRAGTAPERDAQDAAIKAALAAGADPLTAGEATQLPAQVEPRGLDAISRELGSGIASAVADAPIGTWIGPVTSPFGRHLLRVDARSNGGLPPFSAVRSLVLREWENARRVEARAARLKTLRQSYDIVIESRPTP